MKILYLTCLTSTTEKYDGERIKNTLIFEALKKNADVDVIDFTQNKFLNLIKTFFYSLFKKKKYDYFVISKDPHGANIIQIILNRTKVPSSKVLYFEIGPFLYDRILNGTIKKNTFLFDKYIIVETKSMKSELESLGFQNILVFPNFKPIFEIEPSNKIYPKSILNLVYFSRIEDQKGVYDLIDCIKEINKDSLKMTLDIFGRPQNKKDEKNIKKESSKYNYINYKGKIEINGAESYYILSKYDLHVFPTKYSEGFPGTLIDFFIAGVPTLASNFARANDILSNVDSVIFEQNNKKDLLNKLEYIYNNQNMLLKLAKKTSDKKYDYSTEAFETFLHNLFNKLIKGAQK